MDKPHLWNLKLTLIWAAILSLNGALSVETASSEFPRENAVVRAVECVSPAVVNISSEYESVQRSNPFSDFASDPFFERFFRDFFEPDYRRRRKRNSLGSGVIIDGVRGYILTNEHVIARSTAIKVTLKDEREFEAEQVGAAPDYDLAVLRIQTDEALPAIPMGRSDDLMIGETVIAIGNPFGFSNTVTTGVISALQRSIQADNRLYRDFIQTDASINPGNSGGPLLNINGDLIGINTAIYAKAQGIGFAIPINRAKRIVDDLIKYGEVHIPWLGLTVQDLDAQLSQYVEVRDVQGVLISEVSPDSPAEEAGLKPGDIVTSVGGRAVNSKDGFHTAVAGFTAGDVVPLSALCKDKTQTFQVRSRLFPLAMAEELAYKLLGIRVEEMSAETRLTYAFTVKDGVAVFEIEPGCYLDRAGVRPGDLIRRINEAVIKDLGDFKKAVIRYRHKESAVLIIQRGHQQYHVTIKMQT